MPIRSEQELEKAVAEYQRLGQGALSSADADRRDNLNADIQAYYTEHAETLRKAKPERHDDVEPDTPKSPADTHP